MRARAPFSLRRLLIPLAVLVPLAAWRLWPTPRTPSPTVTQLTGRTMGTAWTVKVVGLPVPPERARAAVAEALGAVDGAMSTWKPDSELSRLNRADAGAPFEVSAALREVLALAQQVSARSGGAFDVTVGPLVDAWGFGPRGQQPPPDEATLRGLLEVVDFRLLDLTDAGVVKARDGVRVDLSAIAKGYGVDRAADALEALGAIRYLVEVGGELRVRGLNGEGQPWQVGVERPDPSGRGVQRVLPLSDVGLATSGDYRNFYERGGARVSHTIDPRTGRPIEHALASVTVVDAACARADAWATALNVLGPEAGLDLARRERLSALFLIRQPDGGLAEQGSGRFEAAPP